MMVALVILLSLVALAASVAAAASVLVLGAVGRVLSMAEAEDRARRA